ncbi:sulfotransferase [Actinoplanes teichomyceticus]|uniref:Sulfotransferase family protein n=1 Tax=Actinoplanes teichomyceticus TaxID=1867 RepID=A0A561WJX6_ACTTI|nr:sulfotransferase [Actinoplanes teichomyceticus]TWG24174.1 sulfotransferase family protein [Actinoplanes teichomyceticus]GIF12980.1 sulfotransferase family protein [Actinoplanes teichomyceticus]
MPVKVLYIAGWGRSGTTIVDNILNSYDGVFSTGELVYLWSRGLIEGRKCGCGRMFPRCALWADILDVAFGTARPDPRRITRLQREAVRVRHTYALTGPVAVPAAEEYRRLTERLYRAAAEVTGARLIVDSSKVPSVAALLPGMAGIEPYLLHMIRDPRAVTHSWMRATWQLDRRKPALMRQEAPAASTMHWLIRNALAERLSGAYGGRYRLLRYEDFVAGPRAAIEGLLAFTGMDAARGPFLDDTTVRLAGNHTIAGNPGRFRTGEIALRPDDRWRQEQAAGPRLTATALAFPLLHRYGYRTRISRPNRPVNRGGADVPVRPKLS